MKLVNPSPTIPNVRDLRDGSAVDQVLLVREREIRRTRAGADYMRLALADRTGIVAAVVWDDVEEAAATATAGEPVRVIGTFSQHPRYGPQLTVESLLAPLEVDWERLLDSPATPVAELERRLDAHIAGLSDPHLAVLMERLLGTGSSSGRAFRRAFAAQYNHHAYRSGLLEHSLQVADATAAAARTFAGIDRELALCGALLHDIGKLDAYSGDASRREPERRRQADRRDPERLLHGAARDRADPGLPAGARPGAAAHHPLPPRLLRARQPGAPGNPGGARRARDGQAQRRPRQLRPARTRDGEDETWSRYDRALGRAVLIADRGTAPC